MNIRRSLFRIAGSRRLLGLLLAVVAIGSTGLAVLAYATNLLGTLEGNTINARFAIRGRERPPTNIVIVKIDDKSFQDLNDYPFPRRDYARLIQRIAPLHPLAIAFDIQLSEKSIFGQDRDDAPLALAIQQASHGLTVFSFTETDAQGHVRFLGSPEGSLLLQQAHSHAGMGLFPADAGGVIRSTAYEIGNLKTFGVVTAEVAGGHRIPRSDFSANGHALIDFRGPAGTYPSVSFSDAMRGRVPPSFFRHKIVVIGATAPTLQDIHATSTDSLMSGPEIQASAIDTALRGFPLGYASGLVGILLILLLGITVPVISLRLGPVAATAMAIAMGVAYLVITQLVFDAGTVLTVVYPLGALILSGAGSLAVQLITEAFERARTRDLFSRFVPENVVDELLKSTDGLRLGGVQREATVMFTDLRGFTSLAESLTPARVIEVLNRYLSEMSDAILDHGGTLVAYMGDGIMAVFGAPLPQDDHADRALATAREMLSVRLPRFNQWLRDEHLSEGFKMGIGLNSGHVMSGHVGSERRVEYTAVGDTTNTASRIDEMTKGTPR